MSEGQDIIPENMQTIIQYADIIFILTSRFARHFCLHTCISHWLLWFIMHVLRCFTSEIDYISWLKTYSLAFVTILRFSLISLLHYNANILIGFQSKTLWFHNFLSINYCVKDSFICLLHNFHVIHVHIKSHTRIYFLTNVLHN